jgi:hypothetical protein
MRKLNQSLKLTAGSPPLLNSIDRCSTEEPLENYLWVNGIQSIVGNVGQRFTFIKIGQIPHPYANYVKPTAQLSGMKNTARIAAL